MKKSRALMKLKERDRLFISGYSNVEFGGQARLLFYFLGHTGQIIYFQVFGSQNIYFQKQKKVYLHLQAKGVL
jgi:hypothetical protein